LQCLPVGLQQAFPSPFLSSWPGSHARLRWRSHVGPSIFVPSCILM
jgi:hypothetical protein